MALNQQLLQRLAAAKKKQQTATGTYQQPQQGTWQSTATGHQYVAPGQQATSTTNTSSGNFTPPAGATSTVTGFEDGVKIGPRGSVQRIGGQTTTTYNSMGQQTGTAQKTFNPTTYQSTQPKYSASIPTATKNMPFVARQNAIKVNRVPDNIDYTDILGMDERGLQDYIDKLDISIQNGYKPTAAEQYKVRKASQELQAKKATNSNPYESVIAQAQADYDAMKKKLEEGNATAAELKKKELDLLYQRQAAEQQAQGERQKSSVQSALSFSGFGRSTFNADKQLEIQKDVDSTIESLGTARDLEYQRYLQEQAGATAEQLQPLNAQIAALQGEAKKFIIESAMKMNDEQIKQGMDYGTKVENILKLANAASADGYEQLEGSVKKKVDGWAKAVINQSGDIDENLLKVVPSYLVPIVMQRAGETRQVQGDFAHSDANEYGDGVIYNKKTGEIIKTIPRNQASKYNKLDGDTLYDETTGLIVGQGQAATGDLSVYASQYPREASLKNNNPAGITRDEAFASRLDAAGIPYEKGTPRPANEGGAYFGFPNIESGFAAYDLLRSSPSYTNLTLGQALNRWNTGSTSKGYGNQISGQVGIDPNTKVSQLTPEELRSIQMAQLKRESPGMYKILNQAATEGQPQQAEVDLNTELVNRIDRIQQAANKSLIRGTNLLDPDIKADIDFIKNNLMLKTFAEAKAAGVTFGAASNAEWEALRASATSISPYMSKKALTTELNRLKTSAQKKIQPQKKATTPLPQPTTQQKSSQSGGSDPLGLGL